MVLADTYEKAQQYILEMPKFTKKNSLDDTRLFLEILGSPEKDKKIIHVAGTNGTCVPSLRRPDTGQGCLHLLLWWR